MNKVREAATAISRKRAPEKMGQSWRRRAADGLGDCRFRGSLSLRLLASSSEALHTATARELASS